MPTYMYRREDGTTFEIRQKFSDDPLDVDPKTGQKVQRVIQASGIIFKGSGFYVTDNNGASRKATTTPADTTSDNGSSNGASESTSDSAPAKTETTAAKGTDAAD